CATRLRRAGRGWFRTASPSRPRAPTLPTAWAKRRASLARARRMPPARPARRAPPACGSLPDAPHLEASILELLLHAPGPREVPGAHGDEHGPRLLEPVLDPARPVRVARGQQALVEHGVGQLGVEQLRERHRV